MMMVMVKTMMMMITRGDFHLMKMRSVNLRLRVDLVC